MAAPPRTSFASQKCVDILGRLMVHLSSHQASVSHIGPVRRACAWQGLWQSECNKYMWRPLNWCSVS